MPHLNPGEICAECCYGTHITLRCPNHPNLRWHQKNIWNRNLFYDRLGSIGNNGEKYPLECDCHGNLLYHDHARDGHRSQS